MDHAAPPELKLTIDDYLDALSSVNFGITSKEHWNLCEPIFKRHTQAFKEAPVITKREILTLLRDVLQDPNKGWYITELSLTASWNYGSLTTLVEEVEQLQNFARALLDLYPRLSTTAEEECIVKRIETGIATGSPDSAMAILAHHLPNIKTLRMTMSRPGHNNVFENLLRRVAREYGEAEKTSSLPFQRLRTVSLCHYDTEGCVSAEQVLPFLRFSSLRTFAGSVIGGGFWREGRSFPLYPHPQTNIEEFFFMNCQFEASVIDYLLSCTQNLKRFTYDGGGCIVDDSPYDAKIVLRALGVHARHSLDCLVLAHHSYSEEEFAFRQFYNDELA